MKIAVLGAGSIGTYVGGSLADVADVTLIGRSRVIEALTAKGVTLTSYDGSRRQVPATQLHATTDPDGAQDCDVLLVAVKSGATRSAVEGVAQHLRPDTVVISLQNGLRNVETIKTVLPQHAVIPGMVAFNVVVPRPGTFHQATSGEVMIGADPAGKALVETASKSTLPFVARADMREVQYAKLLLNLMNAVVALADRPLKECLSQRAYRLVFAACQREALTVFKAAGVAPAKLGPFPAPVAAKALTLPDAVFTRVASAQLKIDPTARSSMWDDLDQGRLTEIDELQGEVVRMGASHGIATPACERVVALVREAEQAGADRRSWAPADLQAAVLG